MRRDPMDAYFLPTHNTRLGLHYYPDTLHFRESDLKTWLPQLKTMGITWLTLTAPGDRAIPEPFLSGLIQAGIEPVLHFPLPLVYPALNETLRLLLHAYASWGVHYVVFFDRPNSRAAWQAGAWAQAELVERFLDLYLPLAETALSAGLIPVFPPLEPGGDYWDTAFLRAALQGLQRRGHTRLLRSLVLGAYAGVESRPLDWGAGGPERWPGTRPYFTPTGQQDQRGFYIFDWYLTLSQAVLGDPRPVLLFGAGSRLLARQGAGAEEAGEVHMLENLALARLLTGASAVENTAAPLDLAALFPSGSPEPVPAEVLACNFWLLAAGPESPGNRQAWFQPDGSVLPIVNALTHWNSRLPAAARAGLDRLPAKHSPAASAAQPGAASFAAAPPPGDPPAGKPPAGKPPAGKPHPLAHYLLLPTYEWGIADWHLEAIRPFIKRHRPVVGFSLEEAALAEQVTVIGGLQSFSDEALEKLAHAGCRVERIAGDGTSIATQLATR